MGHTDDEPINVSADLMSLIKLSYWTYRWQPYHC